MAHEDFETEIQSLTKKYGVPRRVEFEVEMLSEEFKLVEWSVDRGRRHDVTVFIRHQGKFVVIEKHAYAQSGIMRAPSGGAKPSESLVDAAMREANEETGLDIELERFVLESHVLLSHGTSAVHWVSYVFLARSVGGELGAKDLKEISAVHLRSREELQEEVRPLMMTSGLGGFRYRALMTDAFFEELDTYQIKS